MKKQISNLGARENQAIVGAGVFTVMLIVIPAFELLSFLVISNTYCMVYIFLLIRQTIQAMQTLISARLSVSQQITIESNINNALFSLSSVVYKFMPIISRKMYMIQC